MKYRTMKAWNKRGFKVMKGSKAKDYNKKGHALFSSNQVIDTNYYYSSTRAKRSYGYHFGYDNPDENMDYDLGICGQD